MIEVDWLVGCRCKANCPLVEPGPIGGVSSVGVFQRDDKTANVKIYRYLSLPDLELQNWKYFKMTFPYQKYHKVGIIKPRRSTQILSEGMS